MNTSTYMILKKELESFSKDDESALILKLFKIYTSLEFTKFTDLTKNHKSFYDFCNYNINQILEHVSSENDNSKKRIIAEARHLYHRLESLSSKFYEQYYKEQELFVKKVEDIVGSTPCSILEVGSGDIPYSSILLGRSLHKIASMDKFIISDDSLLSLNITPFDKYFDSETRVEGYDIVVGQKPCSAIKPIVQNCASSKTPYFLELCECNAPTRELSSWKEILSLYDPNIKFSKNFDYAYNLE